MVFRSVGKDETCNNIWLLETPDMTLNNYINSRFSPNGSSWVQRQMFKVHNGNFEIEIWFASTPERAQRSVIYLTKMTTFLLSSCSSNIPNHTTSSTQSKSFYLDNLLTHHLFVQVNQKPVTKEFLQVCPRLDKPSRNFK